MRLLRLSLKRFQARFLVAILSTSINKCLMIYFEEYILNWLVFSESQFYPTEVVFNHFR